VKIRTSRALIAGPALALSIGQLLPLSLLPFKWGSVDATPSSDAAAASGSFSATAALIGLLVSLMLGFAVLGISEMAPGKLRDGQFYAACLFASLGISVWVTWGGWSW
jgi:hypothetical protein